jgi:hypothetical protein
MTTCATAGSGSTICRCTKANGRRDADHDGLSNLGEFRSHTDPQDADTDNDCIGDDDEDADNDGVDNESEMQEHTNPGDADSDNDGVESENCQGADEDGDVENEVDDD